MKSIVLIALTVLMLCIGASTQDTVPIAIDDLKQLRKIAADADYYKQLSDDRQKQVDAANTSSDNWHKLYLSEKDRADRVQGGRVTEADAAAADLKKSNDLLHAQHADDVKEIGRLNTQVVSLKASRKWWGITGAVFGVAAGGFAGYKIGENHTTITSILGQPATVKGASFSIRF